MSDLPLTTSCAKASCLGLSRGESGEFVGADVVFMVKNFVFRGVRASEHAGFIPGDGRDVREDIAAGVDFFPNGNEFDERVVDSDGDVAGRTKGWVGSEHAFGDFLYGLDEVARGLAGLAGGLNQRCQFGVCKHERDNFLFLLEMASIVNGNLWNGLEIVDNKYVSPFTFKYECYFI